MITVAACSDTEQPAEPKAPVSASEVQKKTEDALAAIAAYSDQKKEEYQQAITRQLDAAEAIARAAQVLHMKTVVLGLSRRSAVYHLLRGHVFTWSKLHPALL